MLFFSISCGKVTQLYEERGILCEQINCKLTASPPNLLLDQGEG